MVMQSKSLTALQWYTAFPQIVSRVGHDNKTVFKLLALLIARVIQEYPQQSLWLFVSAVKSTKTHRAQRGRSILDELQVGLLPREAEDNDSLLFSYRPQITEVTSVASSRTVCV